MKTNLATSLLFLIASFLSLGAHSQALQAFNDPLYFMLKEQHIEEVVLPKSELARLKLRFAHLYTEDEQSDDVKVEDGDVEVPGEGMGEGININTIVNLGKLAWELVAKNKPVVNIKYDFANAFPEGIKRVDQLENFSDLQFKSYRVWGTNMFGMNVYDITYTLVFRYGGSYQGKGQFLDTLSIVPQKVTVMWGYDLGFNVSKVAVSNIGNEEAPVASALMEAHMTVKTSFQQTENRFLYEVQGDKAKVKESSQNLILMNRAY